MNSSPAFSIFVSDALKLALILSGFAGSELENSVLTRVLSPNPVSHLSFSNKTAPAYMLPSSLRIFSLKAVMSLPQISICTSDNTAYFLL
ncbi:hypothetical protein DSECCO2_573400 [anaerobic digester metagenome]